MAWYDRLLGRTNKDNPAQYIISRNEGLTIDSKENRVSYKNAYERLEVVNRAVNMIVDDVSEIPFVVSEPLNGVEGKIKNVRRSRVDLLLNREPNPFQDISTFKRNLLVDLLIDGNIFCLL
jgi:phage portal protein BeeE